MQIVQLDRILVSARRNTEEALKKVKTGKS